MSRLETNLNTRPRPRPRPRPRLTALAKSQDRDETETAKIGLETFITGPGSLLEISNRLHRVNKFLNLLTYV